MRLVLKFLAASLLTAVASVSSPASAAGPSRCAAAQLRLTLVFVQGAAGSRYADFSLQNTGSSTCRLRGFPIATLLGRHGRSLHVQTHHDGPRSPRSVILPPGRRAFWTLHYHPFTSRPCRARAYGLSLIAPGDSHGLHVPFVSGPICRDFVGVWPVRAQRNP